MYRNPLVTIGLSTYNRADGYLKNALDAAVSQTWANLEIIVSDNCSDDNTEELVMSYSDQRIKYIRQKENIGAANNFNFCLEQAKGDYFLLLHDDDLIDSDFIETCMGMVIKNGDSGIIRTGTRLIDGEGNIRTIKSNNSGVSITDFLLSWFSDNSALYLCSTLYNTKGLREVGGFTSKTNLFNDVAPILKLVGKYGRLDVSNVKASFRRHDENFGSSVTVEKWVQDSLYVLDIIRKMDLEYKDHVIKRAQRFFSRKCYRYIKAIPFSTKRLAAYHMVYQKFGYQCSPLTYYYSKKMKPKFKLSYIKNKISLPVNWTSKKMALIRNDTKIKPYINREDTSEEFPHHGKKRLRVAFFVGSFPLISETFILNQITGLIDRGHTVDIYATRYVSGKQFHEDIHKYGLIHRTHFLNLPNKFIHRVFKLIFMLFYSGGWRKSAVIARTLNFRKYGRSALTLSLALSAVPFFKKKPYDILHCQFGFSGPLVLSLKEVKAVTGKLIISFRGVDLTRNLISNPNIYSNVFKHADCFLPVSGSFRQKLILEGCTKDKIKVHHSGIDSSRFKYEERTRKNGEITNILTIGRLVEKKGIAYAIRAIALTVASGRRIKHTIIGDGALRNELQSLISLLRMDNYISLVGSKTSDEVIAYLNKAHILLAPSITSKSGDCEGIPNASKEAMSMGIPVLSTYHSGNPELIEDGISGYLVPERDVNALAERLEYLIDNPEIWPDLGRAGREVIESKFEINKLNDELIDIYISLINDKFRTRNSEPIYAPNGNHEKAILETDHLISNNYHKKSS